MTGVSLYVSLNIYHQTMKAKAGPVISSKKSWPSLGRHPGGGQALSGQLRGPPPAVQLRQNLLSSLFPNLENEGVE